MKFAAKQAIDPGAGFEAKTPCNGCKLCCHALVILTLHDDPSLYETREVEVGTTNGARALIRKPGGACLYLGPEGCTIYDKRPVICRTFDCAGFVKRNKKSLRRMIAEGIVKKRIVERGRQLLKRGYRPVMPDRREEP